VPLPASEAVFRLEHRREILPAPELLVVDPMAALDLAILLRCRGRL
jgi:hypothetical protein